MFHKKIRAIFLKLTFGILLYALWLFWHWDIYGDPRLYLPNDNMTDHFTMFQYLSNSFKHLRSLPEWRYDRYGGIWMAAIANIYSLGYPVKWVGVLASLLSDLPLNTIFKLNYLVFGFGLFLGACFLLAKKVMKSTSWALLFSVCLFFSGNQFGLLHQENLFSIVFFVPFLWLLLIQSFKSWSYIPLLGSCFGLSLNILYPQYVLCYWPLAICSVLVFSPSFRNHFLGSAKDRWGMKRNRIFLLTGVLCFVLTLLPVAYAYLSYSGSLASSLRGMETAIKAMTFRDYYETNILQSSSVWPANLLSYINPSYTNWAKIAYLDKYALFAGPGFLFALLIAVLSNFQYRKTLLFIVFGLALLSTGIYGPLPKLLWYLVPFLEYFRQWFGFLPILNLHVLFFSILALKAFVEKPPSQKLFPVWLLVGVILSLASSSGLVSPLAALPPVLFILLRRFESALKVNVSNSGFLICCFWLIPVHFIWSNGVLNEYRRVLSIRQYILKDYRDREISSKKSFVESLFFHGELKEYERTLPVAQPLGFSKSVIERISAERGMLWNTAEGLRPVTQQEIEIDPVQGGFRFHILQRPPLATHLVVLQFNDGQWRYNFNGQSNSQSPTSHEELKTLQVPISKNAGGFFVLTRSRSAWSFLYPLIGFLFIVALGTTFLNGMTFSFMSLDGLLHRKERRHIKTLTYHDENGQLQ